MIHLLASQKLLMSEISEIVQNESKFRNRCFLVVGKPGVGKTVLAKTYCEQQGTTYLDLSDGNWSEDFIDSGRSLDHVKAAIRRSATQSIVFVDGLTPFYVIHGLEWCRSFLRATSDLTIRRFAFLLLTVGEFPGSPHPLVENAVKWFADKERILRIEISLDDTKEFCARVGRVPVSGANLYELQITS